MRTRTFMRTAKRLRTKQSRYPKIVIAEYGSQSTPLIGRAYRELGYRTAILPLKKAAAYCAKYPVDAVILAGGFASVNDHDAPPLPRELLYARRADGKLASVLGICYGMQNTAKTLGGKVRAVLKHRGYAKEMIVQTASCQLLAGTPKKQLVWASHGDTVQVLPRGFRAIAHTDRGAIAAMAGMGGRVWGVQFHPEVTHTKFGKMILENFARLAGCKKDWRPKDQIVHIRKKVLRQVGNDKAVMGWSGGVDSSVTRKLLANVLGKKLLVVVIDGGQFRHGELSWIKKQAKWFGKSRFKIVNIRKEMFAAMKGLLDAEAKRKAFQKVYFAALIRAAKAFGAKYLIQGTLAADRIESGATGGDKIKTHHNVGYDTGALIQIHPLQDLFKYEVRELGRQLGLPEEIWNRQPFPGPGLFLRCPGLEATRKTIGIVRWADHKATTIAKRRKVYGKCSQFLVGYLGTPLVGIKGDKRVYKPFASLRAIETIDFMTAKGIWFPNPIVDEIKQEVAKHPEISRCMFDPTDKPPGTTEFE